MNKLFEVGKLYRYDELPVGCILAWDVNAKCGEKKTALSGMACEAMAKLLRVPDDYFPRWIPGNEVKIGDEISQPVFGLDKAFVHQLERKIIDGSREFVVIDSFGQSFHANPYYTNSRVILHSRQPVKKEMTAAEAEAEYYSGLFCGFCLEESKTDASDHCCGQCDDGFYGTGAFYRDQQISAMVSLHLENLGMMKPVVEFQPGDVTGSYSISVNGEAFAESCTVESPWTPQQRDAVAKAIHGHAVADDEVAGRRAFHENLTMPHVGDTIFISKRNCDGEVLSIGTPGNPDECIVEVRLNFRDKTGRVIMVQKEKFDLTQGGWGMKGCPHKTTAPKPSVIAPLQIDNPKWPIIGGGQ